MKVVPSHSATPLRVVSNPIPVRVTGTALPVVLKDPSPIPVVNTGPPDRIAQWTLIVAILTLAATVVALIITQRSIYWAKKDFEISRDQALKADAERRKKPDLTVLTGFVIKDPTLNLTGTTDVTIEVQLLMLNNGERTATSPQLVLQFPDGLQFVGGNLENVHLVRAVEKRYLYELRRDYLAARTPTSLGSWRIMGEPGEYSIAWLAQSAEGAWPTNFDAPVEQWGRLKIALTS